VVPKLGRHYSEVWEDEDIALDGVPLPGFTVTRTGGSEGLSFAPAPKWAPSTLTEPDLLAEERGHGPLTERLVSALLPMPDMTVWKGVKAAEDAMEGRPGGSGAAAAKREKVNVALLEDRIRDTMRFHGLLEATVSSRISSFVIVFECQYVVYSPTILRKWMIRSLLLFAKLSESFGRSWLPTKLVKNDSSRSPVTA